MAGPSQCKCSGGIGGISICSHHIGVICVMLFICPLASADMRSWLVLEVTVSDCGRIVDIVIGIGIGICDISDGIGIGITSAFAKDEENGIHGNG